MSGKTKIEWTDASWNPIRGCSRISEGCRNCYAERVAARFSGPGEPYEGLAKYVAVTKYAGREFPLVVNEPRWTGEVRLIEEALDVPLRWKKPRRIFVNSMSDLFHEKVPYVWMARIWSVMKLAPQHTFQILTKRPQRMQSYCADIETEVLPNVWLGVSVEDQETADERIPLLLQTPAAVRWVSYEPALGPVDFRNLRCNTFNAMDGIDYELIDGGPQPSRLNWIVCGGESGPGARPMHPDWARSVREQCQSAGVPFFFKQWGNWKPICALYGDPDRDEKENGCGELFSLSPSGEIIEDHQPPDGSWLIERVGKKAAGRLLDGREWNEFPGSPVTSHQSLATGVHQ